MQNTQYEAYLFAHFIGESERGEQIYFSISKDGLHWTDLKDGKPFVESTIGEMGARDPFLLRSELDGEFYLIATDLRIASKKGWQVAQYEGSKKLLVWKSKDLVQWSNPWYYEVEIPGAGCVWAPEAIYDQEHGEYLVYWASMIQEAQDSELKQKIFCARTKDFKIFTKPVKFLERKNHVIDSTMIYENEVYYRFSKDETTKNIRIDASKSLEPGSFEEISSPSVEQIMGVEGPIIFPFYDRKEWCLLVDQFATGKGYLPLVTTNLNSCEFRMLEESEYDMGETLKRHGSVLPITMEEYERLSAYRQEKRMEPIITVCGDDCSVCPRYLAKTEEELKKVAEFWYLVGWRDHVVSPEEIQCHGCSIHNNCRYHILACTIDHNVVKCKECSEYPCDKIEDMFRQSDEMEAQCKRYLSEREFEQFKRAFYEKRKNLEL